MAVHVFQTLKTTPSKPRARISLSQAPTPAVPYQWEHQLSEWVQARYATSTSVVMDPNDLTKLSQVVWIARPVGRYFDGTPGSQGHILPFSTYYGGGHLRFDVETGLWPEAAVLEISGGNSSTQSLYVTYDSASPQNAFDRLSLRGSPYSDTFFLPRATAPTFHLSIKNVSIVPAAVCYPYDGSLWGKPLVSGDSVDTPDPTQTGPGGHSPKFRTYAESVNVGRVAATPDPIGQMPFSLFSGQEWNVWVNKRTRRRNATRFGSAALIRPNVSNLAGRDVAVEVQITDSGGGQGDYSPLAYKVRNSRTDGEYAGEADATSVSQSGTTLYFYFKHGDTVDGVVIAPTHYGSKPTYMLKGYGFAKYYRIHNFETVVRRDGAGGLTYSDRLRPPYVKTKVIARLA